MMAGRRERCDCCGEFKRECTLYVLQGICEPEHPFAGSVAVCKKCSDRFEKYPAKCKEWLDEKMATGTHRFPIPKVEAMNYEPNTEQWRWYDLVIHDADAKHPKMLMKVIGFTRDGLVKTQYLDQRGIRKNGLPRKVYENEMKYLHAPERFDIFTKGLSAHMSQKEFDTLCCDWDMVRRWNKAYEVGQKVYTTSDDGGFETITGGHAYMWGTSAHIWLKYNDDNRGGSWLLRFVEAR